MRLDGNFVRREIEPYLLHLRAIVIETSRSRLITPALVRTANEAGLEVAAWTVRRRSTFLRLGRLGVRAVCVEAAASWPGCIPSKASLPLLRKSSEMREG